MDIKNSKLDDSADIYKKRPDRAEPHKLKELHGKAKFQYFKDYYLKITLIILGCIGFVSYFIYSVWLAQKVENVLSVAIADYPLNPDTLEDLGTSFGEYIGINKETQDILLDNGYYLSSGDFASNEKLSTYMFVGEVDIIIAKESVFQNYVFSGGMTSLTDILPTDLYSMFSDQFYYGKVRQNDEETIEESNSPLDIYGIYLDNCPLFESISDSTDRPVLGIVASGKHAENSVEFIRYLFQEYKP